MSGPAQLTEAAEATLPGDDSAVDMVAPGRLERGATLGRYVVLARIGAGAMGTVYAAYDPKLDRKVAVKLLRSGRSGPRARLRLQREAQALARLSHPNVVAVHDVGELGGHVFVAMEFVQGQTLREWIGARRSWQQTIEVFTAAAEGLAAAHAVDLVHRDFKPDNVMLGEDGRVRVMDFGLARAGADTHGESVELDELGPSNEASQSGPIRVDLTRTGAMLGSPGYMAPELFAGRTATAQSDQFAFCVALHEALLGVRPFRGPTPQALARAVLAGERRKVTVKRSEAPSWLIGVVNRGLAIEPNERFADMRTLLEALRSGVGRRRRGRAIGLLGLGGLTIALSALAPGWIEERRTARCIEEGATIEEFWNEDVRAEVKEALLGGGPLGDATQQRVVPRLDRAATTWRDESVQACMEASVHGRWDGPTRAKAGWCLDRQRLRFETVVARLAAGSSESLHHGVTAAAVLAEPPGCATVSILARMPAPPPAESRPRYEALMQLNRKAIGLQDSGEVVAALSIARSVRRQAARRQWNSLAAEAEMIEGHAHRVVGDMDGAERRLMGSYVRAAKAEDWMLAAESASQLGAVVGTRPGRVADGRAWLHHAEVAAHHAGDPLGVLLASRLHGEAMIDNANGDRKRGTEQLQRAAALFESALGSDHPRVGQSYAALGAAQYWLGDHAVAEQTLKLALELLSEAYGPEHPLLVPTLNNIGPIAADRGDYEASAAYFGRALKIVETSVGKNTPMAAALHQNLGELAVQREDFASAAASYRRALQILERDDQALADRIVATRISAAWALAKSGDDDDARHLLEGVLETCDRGGCEPVRDAQARFALAKLLDANEEAARARALAEAARSRYRAIGKETEARDVDAWLAREP